MNENCKIELLCSCLQEARKRLPVYALAIFFIWPIFSALSAAAQSLGIPYYAISLKEALSLALAAVIILSPDFIIIGFIALMVSLLVFSILATSKLIITLRWRISLIAEPALLFFSLLFCSTLFYPAVLSHPVLSIFKSFPVWFATFLLGLLVILESMLIAKSGSRLLLIIIVISFGLLSPVLTTFYQPEYSNKTVKPSLILLGIDSLSHNDNLSTLKNWSEQANGTWYSHAVTPGLLTNSVWTSLITMRPISDHKVFYVFQLIPQNLRYDTLIDKARSAGYRTIAVFTNQLTCWIGNQVGFDDNEKCGPVGWRQLATSFVENNSILLPLLRPLLPKLPFSNIPPNHEGTFTYKLNRELDAIFSLGSFESKAFIAAHLNYLHNDCYPSYIELSNQQRLNILRSKVDTIRDRSFDWQGVSEPGDPFNLREWKVQRLQKTIVQSIEKTKFLERGGRLLLFSDHGDRAGISTENFCQELYLHVLLVTFGLQTRDPDAPISLIEAGNLLGLNSRNSPFDPVVEFTMPQPSESMYLKQSTNVGWDGVIELDNVTLRNIFKRLGSCRPFYDNKTFPRADNKKQLQKRNHN